MIAQRRFVADAAHQLRTPLAAILLCAERAQRAANSADEQGALQGLHAAAERAARLSRQLLTLARAEPESNEATELKPVDLVALARSTGEEWIPRALTEDIDFGLVAPNHAVVINGNAGLLGELLSNLLDNAFRYSGRGSHITVTVTDAPPSIAVDDDGPGIPTDERDKIFERFHRVEGTGTQGCGLGLAIVREIANLHRATVQVGDGGQKGSRFTVRFG
jgi:two-component system sensor histidine kinase TctE